MQFRGEASLGNVAIVGSGQIGTMIGMALRDAGRGRVSTLGMFDRDPTVAQASFRRGAGDRVLTIEDEVLAADTIILCVPVPEILRLIARWTPRLRAATFLVDTGSAKSKVVDAMRVLPGSVHAIGGHPMVGTQQRGPEGARAELLQEAAFILTPARDDPHALRHGAALARAVGARPVEMTARAHDELIAVTSHVPHVAAFALVALATRRIGAEHMRDAVGSGYAGATRLAGSNPEMVAGFLWANASELRVALREFTDVLEVVASHLDEDPQALAGLLRDMAAEPERVP